MSVRVQHTMGWLLGLHGCVRDMIVAWLAKAVRHGAI
jgi:hypothetical protein